MGKKIDFQKAVQNQQRKQEKQQLQLLIQCLQDIFHLYPWNFLESNVPLAYVPKDFEKMFYFSCVQDAEDSMGIMIYPSPQDYARVCHDNVTARQEARNYIELECYIVSFTSKAEVPADIQRQYHQFSLDFGDGLWPWLSHKRRGYLTDSVGPEVVDLILDCMKNLYMQLRALSEDLIHLNFENGDMLLRFYSPQDKLWMNVVTPFHIPEQPPQPIFFREDSPKLRKLLGQPLSHTIHKVEFDFGWLDEPVEPTSGGTPYFPLQVIFTVRDTGDLLSLYHCRPEELMDCAFTAWSELIYQHGIPQMLYVCREESYDLFEDFAHKLGVKLKQVKHLPAAQRALRDLDGV